METCFQDRRSVRRWWWLGITAALVAGLAPIGVDPADAVVLCQRKNKVKIRPDACKGKETLVQDLAALGTDVAAQGAQASFLDDQLRLGCAGTPALVESEETDISFYYDNISCTGGCRKFDGNQAGCEGAWALSEDGATSCFFFNSLCLPCADCGQRRGVCQNRCRVVQTPLTCAADPTRTNFVGGPSTDACRSLSTQADCEAAFHAGLGKTVATCYWDGSECRGCGARSENGGSCTNTCRTRTCADPARTTLNRCTNIGNDPVACAAAWHLSVRSGGEPASCWFDAANTECRGCGIDRELQGDCTNTCRNS